MKRFIITVFILGFTILFTQCTSSDTDPDDKAKKIETQSSPPQKLSNSYGMQFVYIAPGSFIMGSPDNEPGRYESETQHQVTFKQGYYMQTTEVTQKQWYMLMGNNPSNFTLDFSSECGDKCPVERVSWNDVQVFIQKLNTKEKTDLFRLPTEAEWEYAARAGTQTTFAFGDCLSTAQANYRGDYPLEGCLEGIYRKTTLKVGSFKPNAWGLYDMHGNVSEWCSDWFGEYPKTIEVNPTGPKNGSFRVIRGGSWFSSGRKTRAAFRAMDAPSLNLHDRGFRLVRDLNPRWRMQ